MSGPGSPSPTPAPAVVAESTWRALASIRHEHLLHDMFGRIAMARQAAEALWADGLALPEWLEIHGDVPEMDLPSRVVHVQGTDRATIMLAIHLSAKMTLVEGKAILEKVKLSYIKAMSTVALIVQAYQTGHVKAARPLLVALERKGHEMPPPEQMTALLAALDTLE